VQPVVTGCRVVDVLTAGSLIARVVGAGIAVVANQRYSGIAGEGCIACLRPVAGVAVVALGVGSTCLATGVGQVGVQVAVVVDPVGADRHSVGALHHAWIDTRIVIVAVVAAAGHVNEGVNIKVLWVRA
jgi:hypothetical protein